MWRDNPATCRSHRPARWPALAAAIPNDAVIVDETITAADALQSAFELNRAGDYFNLRGGGIGQGVAGALGVAVANPERPVIAMSGDGSAMYSIQALWTRRTMA